MPRRTARVPRALILPLLAAIGLGACAVRGHPADGSDPRRGHLITREQIARSGAATAWDALQRLAPQLTMGERTRIQRRGRDSFHLSEDPAVVVDGTLATSSGILRSLRADHVFSIRVLSALEGTTYYGLHAGSGVIIVRTRQADDPGA
jgi:hypothetical protein